MVNQCQLFDLKQSELPSVASTSPNGHSTVPSFLHPKSTLNLYNNNSSDNNNSSHHYNTRSKHKAATAGRQAEVNTIITYLYIFHLQNKWSYSNFVFYAVLCLCCMPNHISAHHVTLYSKSKGPPWDGRGWRGRYSLVSKFLS